MAIERIEHTSSFYITWRREKIFFLFFYTGSASLYFGMRQLTSLNAISWCPNKTLQDFQKIVVELAW